jgi:hypothetical protein
MVERLTPMAMLAMLRELMVARLTTIILPILPPLREPMVVMLTPIMVRGGLKPQRVAPLIGVMVLVLLLVLLVAQLIGIMVRVLLLVPVVAQLVGVRVLDLQHQLAENLKAGVDKRFIMQNLLDFALFRVFPPQTL